MVAWARQREDGGKPLAEEDRRLIGSLRRRDASVIAEIDSRYGQILSGFLRNALDDPATAEDVHQQVLVEIWRRGGPMTPTAPRRSPGS